MSQCVVKIKLKTNNTKVKLCVNLATPTTQNGLDYSLNFTL